MTAQQGQVTKRTADWHNVRALLEESTDTEASHSPASSLCTRTAQRKQHKRRGFETLGNSDDSSEKEQIAALVAKLREGHSRRQQQELDVEDVSKQALLQLGRDILGDCNNNAADYDAFAYQQRARKIDLLISVSTAMRMVGYYLRAVLAARLKRSHKSTYVRSARLLLGLKSSADMSAYPAFYAYVQEHCPGVAGTNGEMDIEAWLQEPIFLADIGWLEWRRYLGKPQRWILDAAMEQFTASLQPAQDWMQRGWVEEYDDVSLGRGVRAVRDIPLCTSKGDSATVVADLATLLSQVSTGHDSVPSSWYRLEWNGGKQQVDAEHHWIGKINHLPMPLCNLKLLGNGKLVQRRPIAVGEPLTFDYGVEWWAHRVTGMPWKQWMTTGSMSRRKGSADLFTRMHQSVLDYTALLSKDWDKRLGGATSEVEREQVLLELWEDVVPSEEQEQECEMQR